MTGTGANVWGSADEFQFAYVRLSGDVDLRGRLVDFNVANEWSKAGLMIRESLSANARNAYVMTSQGTGTSLQGRTSTGGTTLREGTGPTTTPIWLRIVRQGGTISAYRSADGQSWTFIQDVSMTLPSEVYVGLAVTSRQAGVPATAMFENVAFTGGQTSGSGSGWANRDLGSPGRTGSFTLSSGTFTVVGSGADIWSTSDQFHFGYQAFSGDVEVIARLSSLSASEAWAKAGVMIRTSLTSGSRNAFMFASRANGWAFQSRLATDGVTYSEAGPSGGAPGWVRLVRQGSQVSGYYSTDGSSWRLVGSDSISLGSSVYVGLAVTSHNRDTTATASFTNVVIRTPSAGSNQPPSVTLTAPTSGQSYTAPATISMAATANDSDGSIARVDFYRGTTLIGSDTTSPYTASMSSVAAGSYSLRAVATDNDGATANSATVSVTVNTTSNQSPTVTLTSPTTGATFTAPANITLAASASDADGTVARVDFYRDSTLVASDTTSPYSATWSSAPAGSYQLTAVARDNAGAARTSTAVSVTVNSSGNAAPTVAITSPAPGASFVAPASFTIQATASDSNGSVTRVEFYHGTTLINTDTTSPYTASVSGGTVGSYSLTARAYDNNGASATSVAVPITISTSGNQLPNVSITSPSAGASFLAPASVSIAASASDSDGTIAGVDFYAGTQLIASDNSSPYTATWSNVPGGTYNLTAVARDNGGGARTSTAVSITVSTTTQTTRVQFTASDDHVTNVTSYVVAIYRSVDSPTGSPVATRDLGKPSPTNGSITVDISTLVNPLPTGSYYAIVRASNAAGSTASTASATFSK